MLLFDMGVLLRSSGSGIRMVSIKQWDSMQIQHQGIISSRTQQIVVSPGLDLLIGLFLIAVQLLTTRQELETFT